MPVTGQMEEALAWTKASWRLSLPTATYRSERPTIVGNVEKRRKFIDRPKDCRRYFYPGLERRSTGRPCPGQHNKCRQPAALSSPERRCTSFRYPTRAETRKTRCVSSG